MNTMMTILIKKKTLNKPYTISIYYYLYIENIGQNIRT